MNAVIVGSVRSAGATTLAMALAGWIDGAVLIEADPDGGVLALRYGLGREPGLITLAASRQPSATSASILDHAQRLPGGLPVVVAPESPDRATQLLRTTGDRMAPLLAPANPSSAVLVVDAGRLSPSSPWITIARSSTAPVLVVARPRAEELVAAAERVMAMGSSSALVLVGSGPYSPPQVAAQLSCPVIATIADDPRAARALADGGSPKAFVRSELFRSVRDLATEVVHSTPPATTGTLPGTTGAPTTNGHRRTGAGATV